MKNYIIKIIFTLINALLLTSSFIFYLIFEKNIISIISIFFLSFVVILIMINLYYLIYISSRLINLMKKDNVDKHFYESETIKKTAPQLTNDRTVTIKSK